MREAEVQVLGYDHQNIAEALLKSWKYPAALVLSVGNHHQPSGARPPGWGRRWFMWRIIWSTPCGWAVPGNILCHR